MHHIKRYRPSPAMIVAIIALVLSLGGTSYAAIVLPAGSVGTKQLKSNAVIGSKVKNGSLSTADISAASLSKLGRVAMASDSVAVTGAGARVTQVAITAPSAGFVLVQGWVTANSADGVYYVRVWDDTGSVASPYYNGCTATGTYTSVGNAAVFKVPAGLRRFSVRVETSSAGSYTAYGTITAQFSPFNGVGTKTIAAQMKQPAASQQLP